MRIKHLFLFIFLIGFVTCQKEDPMGSGIAKEEVHKDLHMASEFNDFEVLNFDQVSQEPTFIHVNNKFGGVEDHLGSELDELKEDSPKSKKRKFTIVKENINVIRGDGWTSYTFLVKRKNNPKEGIIENLVLRDAEEEKSAFLIKYKPTKKWIRQNKEFEHTYLDGQVKVKKLKKIEDLFQILKGGKSSLCPYTIINYFNCTNAWPCDGQDTWETRSSCAGYINNKPCQPRRSTYVTMVPCGSIPGSGGNGGGFGPDNWHPIGCSGPSCGEQPGGGGVTSGTNTGSLDDYIDDVEKIIDNTKTPCVQSVIAKIKDDTFGPNLFVNTLREIFDQDIQDIELTVVEAKLPASTDGEWFGTGGGYLDVVTLRGDLKINSLYTKTATEDWIMATIIHEMIHAYIQYQKGRIDRGLITQQQFAKMFPLFGPLNSNNQPYDDEADHIVMGHQYTNVIADILKENNPNLSDEEALSLARVGLGNTSYWLGLTAHEQIAALQANQIGRGTVQLGSSNQKGC